jgi:hypothetical protein
LGFTIFNDRNNNFDQDVVNSTIQGWQISGRDKLSAGKTFDHAPERDGMLQQSKLGTSVLAVWGAILKTVGDSPLLTELVRVVGSQPNTNGGSLRHKMPSGDTSDSLPSEGFYAGVAFVHMGEAIISDGSGAVKSGETQVHCDNAVLLRRAAFDLWLKVLHPVQT